MDKTLLELFNKRYSCRKFEIDRIIEKEKILQCLEAARIAPSASNSQPWKYIVVDEKGLKEKISENLKIGNIKFNQFAKDASALIIITEEPKNIELSIGQVALGRNFASFDIGCSAMSFCLMATNLGLATCFLGIFDEKKIKKLLNIPFNRKIIVIIALGYPLDEPKDKKRKELEKIYSFNNYN